MKHLLTIIILLASMFSVEAQYGVYSDYFNIVRRGLPRYYVPSQNRTFSLVCAADRQVQHHVRFQKIDDELQFAGWRRLSSPENAYLRINIELKSLLIDEFDVQETIVDTRDRAGHPIKVHIFKGVIHYTMVNSWNIKTPGETFYSDQALARASKSFVTDREYDNPRAALDYVRNNRDVFLDQIINDEVMDNIYRIVDIINANYVYNPATERFDLYFFHQKKNPYYSLHRSLPSKIKAHLNQVNENGGLASTEVAIEDVFKHFKKVNESLSFANKKERKGKYAMLYNLAQLNYIFENFAEAKKYAQEIVNSGYYKINGRYMLDKINERESQLIKHNLTTQHFEL